MTDPPIRSNLTVVRFDRDASRYHPGVYKAKRASLVAQLHAALTPLFLGQLKNLHKSVLTAFQAVVLDRLKGEGYDFGEVVKSARAASEQKFGEGASGELQYLSAFQTWF
jgi:hypothetical protein